MEEVIFVGFNYGQFTNQSGQKQPYCNVFVLSAFNGAENDDYHFGGQKAAKYGCVSPDVFKGIKPGTRVRIALNLSQKVSYMVPVGN